MERFYLAPAKDGTHTHDVRYEAPAGVPRPTVPAGATCTLCGASMLVILEEKQA